ncbi:MAG: xanthine dehydrogenase family protein [Treponema sp.]|nr:xanthine dehydrogenase family protein [Candidatus Treponema scatequi]
MRAKKTVEKKELKPIYSQLSKTYFSDLTAQNMLYAKIIRSPVTKGHIKEISFKDCPKHIYFFRATDFGDQNYIETLDIQTEILAKDEVYYKGQPVALIAGPDLHELQYLATQVKIDIEKDTTIKNKEKEFPYAQRFIRNGKAKNAEEFSKLFSKKNYDVKGTWTSVLNAPSCNEPNGAFCNYEKGILTICTPTQWPKHLFDNVTRIFDLKSENICIKKTVSSSAHTNTIWINCVLAVLTSLVAIKTSKPVQLILARHEHIEFMTKKSPISIKMRTSVKKDGTIEANQILIELDSGYHNPFAAEILDRLVIAANNIYCIRHFEIIAKAFESYNPPVSFNIDAIDSQAFFAIESQIDKICNIGGFLPSEFRYKNFERKIAMPFNFTCERIDAAFSALQRQSDLNRKFISYRLESSGNGKTSAKVSGIPLRGIGVSCGFNGIGYYGTNIFACNQKMDVTLEKDGNLIIHAFPPSNSTLEIWKNTAAQILEMDPKQVKLDPNVDIKEDQPVPETISSNLTIMTYLLKKCCLDIQSKKFRKPLPISAGKGLTATQKKLWNKEKFAGVPFFTNSYGLCDVEVEVDSSTYKIKIKKINVIINAGKIVLPSIAENSVKLSIQHTLSELIQGEILECNKISLTFITSENPSTQIDGLISRIVPAAFTSALSQAIGKEISNIPVKTENIFKELSANEDSNNAK